ncbi:MAG TPA: response regulator transcription factor [Actinomycetota bacterium]|nr:response regulator transcription factor [Actinomycetota bacterium]
MLIVDDADDFRDLLKLCLARMAGIDVVAEASDGQEGVLQAAAHRPDLVLLDLSMPVMDGLQAAPLIREESPEVKIVFVSGFEASEMEAKARVAGADAYVEKSAVLSDLESTIAKVFGSGGS